MAHAAPDANPGGWTSRAAPPPLPRRAAARAAARRRRNDDANGTNDGDANEANEENEHGLRNRGGGRGFLNGANERFADLLRRRRASFSCRRRFRRRSVPSRRGVPAVPARRGGVHPAWLGRDRHARASRVVRRDGSGQGALGQPHPRLAGGAARRWRFSSAARRRGLVAAAVRRARLRGDVVGVHGRVDGGGVQRANTRP